MNNEQGRIIEDEGPGSNLLIAQVECYSGHTYAQEPRAFLWEGRRYLVVGVEARWRTPDGPAFRVRVESGKRFELHYQEGADTWSLFPLEDEIKTTDKEVQN